MRLDLALGDAIGSTPVVRSEPGDGSEVGLLGLGGEPAEHQVIGHLLAKRRHVDLPAVGGTALGRAGVRTGGHSGWDSPELALGAPRPSEPPRSASSTVLARTPPAAKRLRSNRVIGRKGL